MLRKLPDRFVILTLYGLCCLMVVLYTNSFPLWRTISDILGGAAAIVPFAAMVIALAGLTRLYRVKLPSTKFVKIRTGWLLAACLFCILAFFLPDPKFPVKRIHVAEYLFLAFLVRYTLSLSAEKENLFWFTCIITALFGIHDEMLQGMHPLRTYGVRDICVNSLAGVAGACCGEIFWSSEADEEKHYGADSVTGSNRYWQPKPKYWLPVALVTFLSLLMLIVPLQYYRKSLIPWWLSAPLAACVTVAIVMYPELEKVARGHGMVVILLQLAVLLIYPVIANVTMGIFN